MFGATVPSYAVFVLAAFVLAILVWRSEVRRLSLAAKPANRWIAAAALVGAIVGSKLGMVLVQTPGALGETLHRALGLDFSGKTVVGALVGAIAAVELAKKWLGIRESTGDQFAIAVPLGFAVGRIGCLFNGCCYGIPARGPIAVDIADVSRQPVQIYEASLLLTLAAVLYASRLKPRPPGRLWRLFLVGFCGIRFGTEFLRGDPSIHLGPLSLVQIVCAVLGVGFGVSLLRRQEISYDPLLR
jgi:phosphatidylglycerol:prolipoprotein diacylglycerol transferase